METIALRFADKFASEEGTIMAHQEVIQQLGYVWFGKIGAPISYRSAETILKNKSPRILLIQSGKNGRYWGYVDKIIWEKPDAFAIPQYYRNNTDNVHTWFRVTRIIEADKSILSKCTVVSSGAVLSMTSMHSMNSFFIIHVDV